MDDLYLYHATDRRNLKSIMSKRLTKKEKKNITDYKKGRKHYGENISFSVPE